MSVLKRFSEKELEYDIYQNRLRAICVQKSLEQERDEAVQKLDKLSKALKDAGIDPEDVLKK